MCVLQAFCACSLSLCQDASCCRHCCQVLVNNAASLGPIDYKKGDNMGQGPLDGNPDVRFGCRLLKHADIV